MKPILFSLGPVHFHSFGMLIALGVLVSLYGMTKKAKQNGFPVPDQLFDLVFVVLISGFLGARIYYVLENLSWYSQRPFRILAVWEGGLIFYGGVLGGFAGLVLFCRFKKILPVRALDFMLPYVALTQGFGRIGCFLNGCCYGKACSLPWAARFPGHDHAVHPTQLYETAFVFVLFFFLSKRYDHRRFDGEVTCLYFIFYAAGRFGIEFFRAGNPMFLFLTWNQWISLVFMIFTVYAYRALKKHVLR